MLKPSIDSLIDISKSRYRLVVAASMRARQLNAGEPITIKAKSTDSLGKALEEIGEGKIKIEQNDNN